MLIQQNYLTSYQSVRKPLPDRLSEIIENLKDTHLFKYRRLKISPTTATKVRGTLIR